MAKANPYHEAMYRNYRAAFKREYDVEWRGDNDELETIIENARGFGTSQEEEEQILEYMRASMNGTQRA